MAHCLVPFMVVLWWREQLIGSGPLLAANNKVYWWSINGPLSAANDKLLYWSTVGSPSLANNPESMQTLALVYLLLRRRQPPLAQWPFFHEYDIGKPMVKLKPLALVVGGPRNIFIF